MSRNLAKGNEIVKLLTENSDLVWVRNSFSQVSYTDEKGRQSEDRSSEPPFTSFRFRSEESNLLEAIREAVRTYSGKIEWILISHDRSPLPGVNWTICPKLTIDFKDEINLSRQTVQHYFRDRMPEFGVSAYEDMEIFSFNLKKTFYY
jgi:hypothetical protein